SSDLLRISDIRAHVSRENLDQALLILISLVHHPLALPKLLFRSYPQRHYTYRSFEEMLRSLDKLLTKQKAKQTSINASANPLFMLLFALASKNIQRLYINKKVPCNLTDQTNIYLCTSSSSNGS